MNTLAWVIGWGVLYTFLQYRFLQKMLGSKYHYTFLWFYLGNLLYGQINVTFSLTVTTRGNLIYCCICAFILNMLLFHGSVIKKCFFTLWMYCIHGSVFGALFPFIHAAFLVKGLDGCPDWVINSVGVAACLVQFLMMEVLQRKLHILKRDFTDQDALYLMYIVLFIYAAVDMITTLFTGIQGLTAEMAVSLAWPCSLIALGGSGLHIYCVVMLEQRLVKRAARQQYQMMDQHLESLKEQYLQLSRFRHDSKNHMLCLKKLLGDENPHEALHYLEQMDGRMEQNTSEIQTGSIFADAILNPKYIQAKRLGIDISISMAVPSEDELAPVDLCCLLANALDNAIEACQRSIHENDPAGWIQMKSCLHKKYWIFEIRNSIHVPPAIYKGKLLSSKRRHAYGTGLQNIRTIVERYKGVMELQSGTQFVLSVMIPRRFDGAPDH